jgi:Tol biopolymer transport system component
MKMTRLAAAGVAFAATAVVPPAAVADPPPSCLNGTWTGDAVAFARTGAGHEGIWAMRSDGSNLRRVTAQIGDTRPAWSPDRTRIAFHRHNAEGTDVDIYVVDADGTNVRDVTNRAGLDDLEPAWSPDGQWIAFHAAGHSLLPMNTLPASDFELWAIHPDGTGLRNVSLRPPELGEVGDSAAWDVKPAWSPDGRSIAFESYRGAVNSDTLNSEIWVMPFSATATAVDAVQLTDTPTSSEWFPSWSPDGTRIAFMREPHGGDFEIWVLSLDTAGHSVAETQLTVNTKHDMVPLWSPDGRRILFLSDRSDGGVDAGFRGAGWNTHELGSDQLADDTWDLYVMNADGSCPTRLTTLGDLQLPAVG